MNTFGVIDSSGTHVDVSHSEKGAKNYATRHHYDKVSIRYNCGYVAEIIAVKNANGYWKPFCDSSDYSTAQ